MNNMKKKSKYIQNYDTYFKEYFIANSEKIKENRARYRERNREKIREKQKEYYLKNRKKIIAYQKEYWKSYNAIKK